MTTNTFVIDSDDKAWELFKQAAAGADFGDGFELELKDWPKVSLKFEGTAFQTSLPARAMHPFIELQKEIYRLYAQEVYGSANINKLSFVEKSALELVVTVGEGSTFTFPNLENVLTEFVRLAGKKMTSAQIAGVVIAIGVGYFGNQAWKSHVQGEVDKKELETRVELSQQETERLKMMAKVAESNTAVANVVRGADDFRNNVMRAVGPKDRVVIDPADTPSDDDLVIDGATFFISSLFLPFLLFF